MKIRRVDWERGFYGGCNTDDRVGPSGEGWHVGLTSRIAAAIAALLALTGGGAAGTAKHIVRPPVAGVFDYQIGGSYRPAPGVAIIDRDWHSRPASGRYNICYVNAFQTQPANAHYWRTRHPSLLLRVHGHYVQDPGWPGEYVLDTSTAAKRRTLLLIERHWLDACAHKGFDAVEPDNLDSWTRHGVDHVLTRRDDLAFARLLVRQAHADRLAIAQKNTVQVSRDKIGFDFAIAEECAGYDECAGYTRGYGRHVIEIEYTDNPRSTYTRACRDRGGQISIILRDRDVTPRGSRHYHYAHC